MAHSTAYIDVYTGVCAQGCVQAQTKDVACGRKPSPGQNGGNIVSVFFQFSFSSPPHHLLPAGPLGLPTPAKLLE